MSQLFLKNRNKTGSQPVLRTCGATPFGYQDSRRKENRQAQNFVFESQKWTN